jgi:hypothetical protein
MEHQIYDGYCCIPRNVPKLPRARVCHPENCDHCGGPPIDADPRTQLATAEKSLRLSRELQKLAGLVGYGEIVCRVHQGKVRFINVQMGFDDNTK